MLQKIAATNELTYLEPWIDDRPPVAVPSLGRVIAYAAKLLSRILVRLVRRGLRLQPTWSVSIVNGGFEHAVLRHARELPAPRGRYWADPMVCCHDGKVFCFVEEYMFQAGRGRISALEISGAGALHRG